MTLDDQAAEAARKLRAGIILGAPSLDAARGRRLRRRRQKQTGASIAAVVVIVAAAFGVLAVGHRSTRTTVSVGSTPTPTVSCAVTPGRYSPAHLRSVYHAVSPLLRHGAEYVATEADAVHLGLGVGQEPLAARLERRYGDALQLSVATVPYCHGPGVSPACPSLPSARPLPTGLTAELRLTRTVIQPTAQLDGTLSVTNHGHRTVDLGFSGNPDGAWMTNLETGRFVSFQGDPPVGTGAGARLTPGQTTGGLPVDVGTARCGTRGSALPPGRYGVVAEVTGGDGGRGDPTYLTAPVVVTVTAAPPDSASVAPNSTKRPGQDHHATTRRCDSRQLSVKPHTAGVAGGTVTYSVTFTNTASLACYLKGYPSVVLFRSNHARMQQTTQKTIPPEMGVRRVTIGPRGRASFNVSIPDVTGYGPLHCPSSSYAEITPPDGTSPERIRWRVTPYGGSIQRLRCGSITLSRVHAASG